MNKLVMHICCAPDATVGYERFAVDWEVLGLFYNPNIEPAAEYSLREGETRRLAVLMGGGYAEGDTDPEAWLEMIKGFERSPEGGARCRRCIAHRLEWSAKYALESGADAFATTLTISPHKDVDFIHSTGAQIGEKFGIKYVAETLRKRDGFKRSLELCRQFGIYRQNYCGCHWSLPGIREELKAEALNFGSRIEPS